MASLAFPANILAQEITDFNSQTLTGDWNGERTELKNDGIDLEATNYFDFFAATSGGTKTLNNLNLNAILDGERLIGANGLTGLVSLLQTNGSQPSRTLTGSAQRLDDMETEHRGFEPYQAWLQQNFFGGGVSILAGLYDPTTEFYSTDASDILINNAYGFGTELAATGKKGEAIFPTSSAAARLRLQPSENFYIQGAVMDGINSAPETRQTIQLDGDSSALVIGEAGYINLEDKPEAANAFDKLETEKIAVGIWRYTDEIRSLLKDSDDPNASYISDGAYAIAESYIFRERDIAQDAGLMGFVRAGMADRKVDRFDYALSTGLDYKGIMPFRNKSELTFGIAYAHLSPVYRESLETQGIVSNAAETAFELTYREYPISWLALQPDFQYILHPDGLADQPNSMVFGIRAEVNF